MARSTTLFASSLFCGFASAVTVWQGKRCDTLPSSNSAANRAFKAAAANKAAAAKLVSACLHR